MCEHSVEPRNLELAAAGYQEPRASTVSAARPEGLKGGKY